MSLQDHIDWLKAESGPKLFVAAMKHLGVTEIPGGKSNPEILRWARELGITDYVNDGTPWCGLFLAFVATEASYAPPKIPLRAKSWATWGTHVCKEDAALGDVLVFERDGGGHVGIYASESSDAYLVLGGNQNDRVCCTWLAKDRLAAVRRSPWRISQPQNVRKILIDRGGARLSSNEK